jgi:hypothetical protein
MFIESGRPSHFSAKSEMLSISLFAKMIRSQPRSYKHLAALRRWFS